MARATAGDSVSVTSAGSYLFRSDEAGGSDGPAMPAARFGVAGNSPVAGEFQVGGIVQGSDWIRLQPGESTLEPECGPGRVTYIFARSADAGLSAKVRAWPAGA